MLSRWVVKYATEIASAAQKSKAPTKPSGRFDDKSCVKVRGEWCFVSRAVIKDGQTPNFLLDEQREETAALKFLAKAITANGLPRACAIHKSGANTAGLRSMNAEIKEVASPRRIRV